jgi:uncharacterized protein (DUF305 family)
MIRSRYLPAVALAAGLAVATTGAVIAQNTGHQAHAVESESGQAYMDAMQTMMEGMVGMKMTGDAGIDFAMMMIPHHQSAIDMAKAYLEHGDDPELTELANEIIAAQQQEIEFLESWLEAHR